MRGQGHHFHAQPLEGLQGLIIADAIRREMTADQAAQGRRPRSARHQAVAPTGKADGCLRRFQNTDRLPQYAAVDLITLAQLHLIAEHEAVRPLTRLHVLDQSMNDLACARAVQTLRCTQSGPSYSRSSARA